MDALSYRNKVYASYQKEYASYEEHFELYSTNNEYEVIMLENEGFHWIDFDGTKYTYILSAQLRQFVVDNEQ